MKEVKFHTLYSEPNGTREEIPALKGKDGTEVPKATDSTYGTIKGGYGVRINANGEPYIDRANDTQIDTKAGSYYPIVPYNLDRAVRAGLVSNSQIADADKPTICDTIGAVYNGEFETVADFTTEQETSTIIANFPAVKHLVMTVIVPAQTYNNSGIESTVILNNHAITFKMTSAFSNQYRSYNVFSITERNGLLFGDYATALNQITNRIGIADRYPINLGSNRAIPLTQLWYAAGARIFPVGTQVIIKGVRV